MEYKLQLSETYIEEIEEICNYVENNLKATEASKRLRRKIRQKILGLKYFPEMYQKIEISDRFGRNYRRMLINNYIILYIVIEEKKTVLISHIYYGRRNYIDGGYL